jgi:hypothetical protein
MGLDMFLQGHQYFTNRTQTIDDFPVKEIIVELGYWRKHPDLHGAIVHTFADGVDDCSPIELSPADLKQLIEMVKTNQLPHTTGFFFGESAKPDSEWYEQEYNSTIKQLENALKWYDTKQDSFRWVIYRASW